MKVQTDIDIDVIDRDSVLTHFRHITASIKKKNEYTKHNSGVYLQPIPYDPVSGLASIEYKEAEERGYFKLDFLNVSIYKDVKDETHLISLMGKEPLWELLEHKDFVDQVFHLSGHDKLLKQLKPTSVEHLAATLAIIRPAKRHLQDKGWPMIMKEVWTKPLNDNKAYYFKKAHAISYAMVVVVHMNLLCEQLHSAD